MFQWWVDRWWIDRYADCQSNADWHIQSTSRFQLGRINGYRHLKLSRSMVCEWVTCARSLFLHMHFNQRTHFEDDFCECLYCIIISSILYRLIQKQGSSFCAGRIIGGRRVHLQRLTTKLSFLQPWWSSILVKIDWLIPTALRIEYKRHALRSHDAALLACITIERIDDSPMTFHWKVYEVWICV